MKLCNVTLLLYIYNLPLKFGSKQSILKIWVFGALGLGFRLSPLELEMDIEQNYHGFENLGCTGQHINGSLLFFFLRLPLG